jgi:hypothetical protein
MFVTERIKPRVILGTASFHLPALVSDFNNAYKILNS